MRFLLFAALLCAAPSLPRDGGRVRLAADAEARWIPFTLTPGNQVRFAMTVDGRPASAILDTGVSHSVISRRFAGIDPARIRPGGRATAIGGSVAVGWWPTRTVTLGALSRRGGGLTVATLPALATGSREPVDLLVGRDLLAAHALDIDYPGRRFRLLPSGRLPFRGASARLTVSPARLVYESEVSLGGRRLRPVVVDTGDGSALTLTRAAWETSRPANVRVTSTIAFGLGGSATSDLAILPELRFGQVVAHGVEVRVEPPAGFSERIGAAGRIGSGLLGRYRVLLDPGARRLVLRAGPEADRAPLRSTSGLLVGVLPDRLRVLHVMRGGPAEGSWAAGDEICAVDGQPITASYPASPLTGWSIGSPGRVVALRRCDGREQPLTLADFY